MKEIIFPLFEEDYAKSAKFLIDDDVIEIPFQITSILSDFITDNSRQPVSAYKLYLKPFFEKNPNKLFIEALYYQQPGVSEFLKDYGEAVFNEYLVRFEKQHPSKDLFDTVKNLNNFSVRMKPSYMRYGRHLTEINNIPEDFRVTSDGKPTKKSDFDLFKSSKKYYEHKLTNSVWTYSCDTGHPFSTLNAIGTLTVPQVG